MPYLLTDTLLLYNIDFNDNHVEMLSTSFRHCLCPSIVQFSAYLFVSGAHQNVLLLISH
jgi:hypothetical protein